MNIIRIITVLAFVAVTLGSVDISAAEQTREACNACCQKSHTDEYYLDQCKLKCYRNHDSCTGRASAKEAEPAAPPANPTTPPPQPAARQQPAPPPPQPVTREQMMPAPPRQDPALARPAQPQPQPQPQAAAQPKYNPKTMLRFPSPLNLTPGREAEAAGQILALNGVPPQHPAYPSALRAIEQVLVNFARSNPSGGQLPTTDLERIFAQIK